MRFSCFTSCLTKIKQKSDDLCLCVTPINSNSEPDLSRTYSIPLIVSANAGRDSGLFVGQPGLFKGQGALKRPQTGQTSGIPVKREAKWDFNRNGKIGNFLTPDAHKMLINFSDAKKSEINFRFGKMLETELEIAKTSGPS